MITMLKSKSCWSRTPCMNDHVRIFLSHMHECKSEGEHVFRSGKRSSAFMVASFMVASVMVASLAYSPDCRPKCMGLQFLFVFKPLITVYNCILGII